MNRRAFLSGLVASGLTTAIDPERLLWVPGKRTIFIPPQEQLVWVRIFLDRSEPYYGEFEELTLNDLRNTEASGKFVTVANGGRITPSTRYDYPFY